MRVRWARATGSEGSYTRPIRMREEALGQICLKRSTWPKTSYSVQGSHRSPTATTNSVCAHTGRGFVIVWFKADGRVRSTRAVLQFINDDDAGQAARTAFGYKWGPCCSSLVHLPG